MQQVDLNLIPRGAWPAAYASQYDSGREIDFDLYEGFLPYPIRSAVTVVLTGRRPDEQQFQISSKDDSKHLSFANSTIKLITTEQMTHAAGKIVCEFQLFDENSHIIGTLNFLLFINKSVFQEENN